MVEIDGRVFIPPTWNDLDRELLIKVYLLMGAPAARGSDTEVIWKRILQMCVIAGLSEDFINKWQIDALNGSTDDNGVFEDEVIAVSSELTKHLWKAVLDEDGNIDSYTINLELTKNPYPVVSLEQKAYYAPDDGWKNMTFYEFGMVWEYMNAWLSHPNEHYGDTLLAILYRPIKEWSQENEDSDYHGDLRQPIRRYEKKITERSELWGSANDISKDILLFWALCCRQDIYNQYIDIFGVGSGDGQEGSAGGFPDIIMELAGNIVDVDRVADQPFHNVLMYLRKLKNDADKQRSKKMK